MKKLFVLIRDNGDGSFSAQYTMNEKWIARQEVRYTNNELDYEWDIGIDGDGFHYDVLTLSDDCTLESLGIHFDCADTEQELT